MLLRILIIVFALGSAFFKINHSFAFDILFPVACQYGKDCFIRSYFDHGPDKLLEDYVCGPLTKQDQKHTEIILRSIQQMNFGIDVLAAYEGKVIGVRDGMDDTRLIGDVSSSFVQGKECGNAVLIDHGRGYHTQYCHLKKYSIKVSNGQQVSKGQTLGQVGMSGKTDFPHLAFSVKRKGVFYDPFVGEELVPCAGKKIFPFWDRKNRKRLNYISTALLNAGFFNKAPRSHGAREGKFSLSEMTNDSDIMTFWADIFGVQAKDEIYLTIIRPDGSIVSSEKRVIKKNASHYFNFIGVKLQGAAWERGDYVGNVKLYRTQDETGRRVIIDSNVPLRVL